MKELIDGTMREASLAYCDYIADRIIRLLRAQHPSGLIQSVGHMQFDLTPEGEFLSTKKTIEVVDSNNKRYRIIVEEV